MIRQAIIVATICPSVILAETLECVLDGVPLAFTIDRNQFVDAQDPSDPPRRKLTTVRMGDAQFPAEPFIMGDVRGFSSEAMGGAGALFVMQPDGTAIYAVARTGERLVGSCEVLQ